MLAKLTSLTYMYCILDQVVDPCHPLPMPILTLAMDSEGVEESPRVSAESEVCGYPVVGVSTFHKTSLFLSTPLMA
ncbi:hypothetical protein PR048_017914 [Dryococelus australis]|uniref:Uncharacterized protein n=1 Tax=Dryococelus australis TaxID=614101 RepID=A0ABQ9HAX1_9NEOP|nr:hypothetical protein PR048_017914 [Dryococelus australis]